MTCKTNNIILCDARMDVKTGSNLISKTKIQGVKQKLL